MRIKIVFVLNALKKLSMIKRK